MENERRDDQRKDGEITSRKSVAPPGCKLQRIETNGRDYLPVVARKADDDGDDDK